MIDAPSEQDFRDVGFTDAARAYPRDDFALALFAAFNGVSVEQLLPAMRYYPNSNTEAAWKRVADAARVFLAERSAAQAAPNYEQSI